MNPRVDALFELDYVFIDTAAEEVAAVTNQALLK